MCCASQLTRFWEVLPPFCRFSSSKGGGGPSHCSCSSMWEGWDVLLLKARAHFSALLISGGPARLPDRCLFQARALSFSDRSCLPSLNLGPKCNSGSWVGELRFTPFPSYFPGQAHTSPGRWVGVKWDGCCLKRKGPVRAISLPGTPPLPVVGLCSGVGILS